jgi:hypothetical protein
MIHDVSMDKAAARALRRGHPKTASHAKFFVCVFLFCFKTLKIWYASSQSCPLVNSALPWLTIWSYQS